MFEESAEVEEEEEEVVEEEEEVVEEEEEVVEEEDPSWGNACLTRPLRAASH